jgi:hypothetical protein
MLQSNCHAKDGMAEGPITRLFSGDKRLIFRGKSGPNPKPVATLSQVGGFQPASGADFSVPDGAPASAVGK